MLAACVADTGEAIAAWQQWCASNDLDAIDEQSLRLLPLAWHRLREVAPADRTLDIAKGVYRRAWYRNQLAFRTLAGVLDLLESARIDAMLLKGASLATRYYPTPATRPMADVDLLVPHRDAERAASLLERAGWSPAKRTPMRELVAYAHGVALARGQDNLDLHWNALWPQRRADVDGPFWERAQRTTFEGRPAYVLDPTDELFHACMHGARRSQNAYSWAPAPLVRWMVDAFMIARTARDRLGADRRARGALPRPAPVARRLRLPAHSAGLPGPRGAARPVVDDARAGRPAALRTRARRPAAAPVQPSCRASASGRVTG